MGVVHEVLPWPALLIVEDMLAVSRWVLHKACVLSCLLLQALQQNAREFQKVVDIAPSNTVQQAMRCTKNWQLQRPQSCIRCQPPQMPRSDVPFLPFLRDTNLLRNDALTAGLQRTR